MGASVKAMGMPRQVTGWVGYVLSEGVGFGGHEAAALWMIYELFTCVAV